MSGKVSVYNIRRHIEQVYSEIQRRIASVLSPPSSNFFFSSLYIHPYINIQMVQKSGNKSFLCVPVDAEAQSLLASQTQSFLHRPPNLPPHTGFQTVTQSKRTGKMCRKEGSFTFTTVSKLSALLIQSASLSPAFLTLTTAPVTSPPIRSACSPMRKRRRLSQTSSDCLCSLLATQRPPAMLARSSQSGFT